MLYNTRPLNDGTNGFRFDLAGIKGLTRKRSIKRRYGVNKGETMVSFHMGKRSVYVQRFNPVRKLYDFALREYLTALANFKFVRR